MAVRYRLAGIKAGAVAGCARPIPDDGPRELLSAELDQACFLLDASWEPGPSRPLSLLWLPSQGRRRPLPPGTPAHAHVLVSSPLLSLAHPRTSPRFVSSHDLLLLSTTACPDDHHLFPTLPLFAVAFPVLLPSFYSPPFLRSFHRRPCPSSSTHTLPSPPPPPAHRSPRSSSPSQTASSPSPSVSALACSPRV